MKQLLDYLKPQAIYFLFFVLHSKWTLIWHFPISVQHFSIALPFFFWKVDDFSIRSIHIITDYHHWIGQTSQIAARMPFGRQGLHYVPSLLRHYFCHVHIIYVRHVPIKNFNGGKVGSRVGNAFCACPLAAEGSIFNKRQRNTLSPLAQVDRLTTLGHSVGNDGCNVHFYMGFSPWSGFSVFAQCTDWSETVWAETVWARFFSVAKLSTFPLAWPGLSLACGSCYFCNLLFLLRYLSQKVKGLFTIFVGC